MVSCDAYFSTMFHFVLTVPLIITAERRELCRENLKRVVTRLGRDVFGPDLYN